MQSTKQQTMNIDGRKVTVRARRRHSRGTPIGWSVKIDTATYFFNVLDPRQAMDKAVAKHRARIYDLLDAIREQLSPHTVAAVATCLQANRTNNPDVDRQVRWLHDQLCELLGGSEQQARLAEELGTCRPRNERTET